jgi:hypothetical protein
LINLFANGSFLIYRVNLCDKTKKCFLHLLLRSKNTPRSFWNNFLWQTFSPLQSSGINPWRGKAGELSKKLTNQMNKIASWVFFSVLKTASNKVWIICLILPHWFRGHWKNNSKVSKMNTQYNENITWPSLPVESHQHQSVYGDKSCGHNEELVKFAPNISKRPSRGEGIVSSCEWDAENYEQDVCNLNG